LFFYSFSPPGLRDLEEPMSRFFASFSPPGLRDLEEPMSRFFVIFWDPRFCQCLKSRFAVKKSGDCYFKSHACFIGLEKP
jgi:hypothetical protein